MLTKTKRHKYIPTVTKTESVSDSYKDLVE